MVPELAEEGVDMDVNSVNMKKWQAGQQIQIVSSSLKTGLPTVPSAEQLDAVAGPPEDLALLMLWTRLLKVQEPLRKVVLSQQQQVWQQVWKFSLHWRPAHADAISRLHCQI